MSDIGRPDLPFVHGPLPDFLSRVTVAIAPGEALAYDSWAWRDSLVIVDEGDLELEDLAGSRWLFVRGSLLWMGRLPLRRLLNPGACVTLLIAVSCVEDPARTLH